MKHIKHGQAIGILANVGMIAGIVTLSHAQDTRPVDLSGIWSTNSLDAAFHRPFPSSELPGYCFTGRTFELYIRPMTICPPRK